MGTRVLSSVAVVAASLIPLLCGGPLFAAFFLGLCLVGFREFAGLANRSEDPGFAQLYLFGYLSIAVLSLAGLTRANSTELFGAIALSVLLPLVVAIRFTATPGAFSVWTHVSSGALYLGLPAFSAIMLRGTPGTIDASWLTELTNRLALGWESTPRGFAWAFAVVLATWFGDSAAYLVGRSLGRHKLAPGISPNKTVEGSVAGFAASIVICVVWFAASGLANVWIAVLAGIVIAVSGQLGDLAESMLKRQAGVKDSGAVIPGHGGILDRIDALLLAFPVTLLVASFLEQVSW